ncbi:MAG TPA: GvpL/GvpF family gas vesicle protein [Solirubrobacterales bacterium]|nr:GvpL/GvpF family gas vesicle protein [Solirubrobacterales bacterium]
MSGGVLYVYAITDSFPGTVATGLHGATLRAFDSGPVRAIASEHAVVPEPDEDQLWAHERVIEDLMKASTILPMRFGSTVERAEALAAMLEQRQEEFIASLERVRGAVELSVRAQLPTVAEAGEPESRLGRHFGPGTTYLLERAHRQRRSEDAAELIHRPLAALARRSTQKPGSGDPHGFKAAYLVDEGAVEAFAERVGNLNTTLGDVKVSCTGPWPPYSFASEEPG